MSEDGESLVEQVKERLRNSGASEEWIVCLFAGVHF